MTRWPLLLLALLALVGGIWLLHRAPVVPVTAQGLAGAPPGRLLYTRRGDLWLWQNGSARQITAGQRYEGPAWSPDGQRIALSEVGENHSDIVLLTPAGQRLLPLTRHWSATRVIDSSWGRKPAWSPDGARLAYISDAGWYNASQRFDMSLWLVNATGGGQRRLLAGAPGHGLDWPTWSPDGRRLAVTGLLDDDVTQIYSVSLTGAWTRLTRHRQGAYDPAWSPDGDFIAYIARENGQHALWVMNADGSDPVLLLGGEPKRAPTWSPDGRYLAFLQLMGSGFDLYVVEVQRQGTRLVMVGQPRRLTSGQDIDETSGLSWGR